MDSKFHCEENCWEGRVIPQNQTLPAAELAETEIIDRAKRRDVSAFEWLYRMHSGRVYALCLLMLRNTAEAEDLTQEAFLQLFRKIHTFRGEAAFSTWLHRIAANLVLMRFRRKAPREVSLEDSKEFSGTGGKTAGEIGGADLSLLGTIDRMCLLDAIEKLPPSYKLSIELHDIQGYKHAEMAKIMECSVGTSKAQLHRARKKLRESLKEKLGSEWFAATRRSQVPLTASG